MKGPTYILKKSYIEQEEKREYNLHKEKLKQIQNVKLKGGIIRSISVDRKFVENQEQKKIQSRIYKEEEQKRLQKVENKALMQKLEDIKKGKYSIVRDINDKNYKESIQYLSSVQNNKPGINLNPQRKRIRTITNAESSINPNAYYQQKDFDQLDDPDTQSIQQKDTRDGRFFRNNSQDGNSNQSKPKDQNDNTQTQLRSGYNHNSGNEDNSNIEEEIKDNSQNISSQNFNPNTANGTNRNKDKEDPNVINFDQNNYQNFSKTPNSDIYKDDLFKNNQYHKQPNPRIYGMKRDKQSNVIKTEGNYNDDTNLSDNNIQNNYNVNNNQDMNYNDYNNDYDNEFRNQKENNGYIRNQKSQERLKQVSQESKRRRINSSINLAQLNKNISASIERQREQERIQIENNKIVQRIMKLPPVIPTKSNLKKESKQQKQLMKQISKFHEFKERKKHNYLSNRKDMNGQKGYNNLGLQDGIPLDENNQELMDQRVHLVINVKEIAFINFLPISTDMEKYFIEIQASVHEIRRTNPEVYLDFSKSVINEFFYLRELKQCRIMYMGLYKWTPVDNGIHFLGDFELDLTPYYLQTGVHQIHYELRNYKQTQKLPNYMVKDMRKKGWIDIEISVRSSVKQYLMDLDIIQKEDVPQYESNQQKEQNMDENPAEKKKNSEDSLIQLLNQNQIQQTEKQQQLIQKYSKIPSKKMLHYSNKSINQGNKSIPSLLQSSRTKCQQSNKAQNTTTNQNQNQNQNQNNNEIDFSKNQAIEYEVNQNDKYQ